MGPITSVNVTVGQGSTGTAQVGGVSRSNVVFGGVGSISAQGSSAGITQIHAAVSQMLSRVGGGLQNDKMLQMLIGLIILLALLREMQGGGNSALGALAQLGQGGSQTPSGVLLFSQTTIEIQQTTSNAAFGGDQPYASSGETGAAQSTGTTIDTVA